MSIYRRWMLVILIAFAQLVAFLGIHLWMANRSMRDHTRLLVEKVQSENQFVANAAMHLLKRMDRRSLSAKSEVRETLESIHRPRGCGIALVSLSSGATTAELPPLTAKGNVEPWDWNAASLISEKVAAFENIANLMQETVARTNACCAEFNGSSRAVTACLLPQTNSILIVYKEMDREMETAFGGSFHSGRNIGYALVLLIGLSCCGLMLSLLTRYGNKISEISDQLERDVEARTREIRRTRNAIIFGLAKLAESRDNDTGDHLERIRKYVRVLGNDLQGRFPALDEKYLSNLELASSLHDIGKVGIPDSILLKPGRLDPQERDVMELHTVIGGECLDAIEQRLGENEFMQLAREVAYHHHERWDGTGYPHAIPGDSIPLSARIVAVADVYDALTSKRPYKRAMSHMESRNIIVSGSGSQFDPEVVDAFLRHEDEFESISLQQQSVSDEEATSSIQRLAQRVTDDKNVRDLVGTPAISNPVVAPATPVPPIAAIENQSPV